MPVAEQQEQIHYGSSYTLVKRMFENGRFQPWTYTPLVGGFLFALTTVVLRKNMRAMAVVNGTIGVGTIAMANGVATTSIVKERSVSAAPLPK